MSKKAPKHNCKQQKLNCKQETSNFKQKSYLILLSKRVRELEIAVGTICGHTKFSFVRIAIRDLVADINLVTGMRWTGLPRNGSDQMFRNMSPKIVSAGDFGHVFEQKKRHVFEHLSRFFLSVFFWGLSNPFTTEILAKELWVWLAPEKPLNF